ncbi:hypothetical protein [Rhodanobacter umsongensis]
MGIEAISSAERERYVDFYIETKSKAMASLKDVVGELLIAINNEQIP